jgi:hypothetical protein
VRWHVGNIAFALLEDQIEVNVFISHKICNHFGESILFVDWTTNRRFES